MDVDIIAILIFIVVAIFIPVSFLATSIMLRRKTVRNSVRGAPYESAEKSKGGNISIMNEYIHYFPMFIAYEIIAVMILVWAPIARSIPSNFNIAIMCLLILGMIFEIAVMLMARKKEQ